MLLVSKTNNASSWLQCQNNLKVTGCKSAAGCQNCTLQRMMIALRRVEILLFQNSLLLARSKGILKRRGRKQNFQQVKVEHQVIQMTVGASLHPLGRIVIMKLMTPIQMMLFIVIFLVN